jgi:hypothetical protein
MPKISRAGDRRRASAGRHGRGARGAVHEDSNLIGKREAAAYKPAGPGAQGGNPEFTQGANAGKTLGAAAGRRTLGAPKLPKPPGMEK